MFTVEKPSQGRVCSFYCILAGSTHGVVFCYQRYTNNRTNYDLDDEKCSNMFACNRCQTTQAVCLSAICLRFAQAVRWLRQFSRLVSLSVALRIVHVCARCAHRCKAQSRPRLLVVLPSCCFYTWRCNFLPTLHKQSYKFRSARRRKQQNLPV